MAHGKQSTGATASLHLRRCLRVLISALRSGILVPTPLSQAKDGQLTVHQVPKYACSCGSGGSPQHPACDSGRYGAGGGAGQWGGCE